MRMRYVTEKQRRCRAIFIATLRAVGILVFFRVARSTRVVQTQAFARALKNTKIPFGKCIAI